MENIEMSKLEVQKYLPSFAWLLMTFLCKCGEGGAVGWPRNEGKKILD